MQIKTTTAIITADYTIQKATPKVNSTGISKALILHYLNQFRKDSNETRYIKFSTPENMDEQLLRTAMDKTAKRVMLPTADGRVIPLFRRTNPDKINNALLNGADDHIGALVQNIWKIHPTAYLSSLSILLGDVNVEEYSVVMGHKIYNGTKEKIVIANSDFYKYHGKDRWAGNPKS